MFAAAAGFKAGVIFLRAATNAAATWRVAAVFTGPVLPVVVLLVAAILLVVPALAACVELACGIVPVVGAASATVFFFVGISAFRSLDAAVLATAEGLGLETGGGIATLELPAPAARAEDLGVADFTTGGVEVGLAAVALDLVAIGFAPFAAEREAFFTEPAATFVAVPAEPDLPAAAGLAAGTGLVAGTGLDTVFEDAGRAAVDIAPALVPGLVAALGAEAALTADPDLGETAPLVVADFLAVADFVEADLVADDVVAEGLIATGLVAAAVFTAVRALLRALVAAPLADVPRGAAAALALGGMRTTPGRRDVVEIDPPPKAAATTTMRGPLRLDWKTSGETMCVETVRVDASEDAYPRGELHALRMRTVLDDGH